MKIVKIYGGLGNQIILLHLRRRRSGIVAPSGDRMRSELGFDAIYPIGPNPHFSVLRWEDYH